MGLKSVEQALRVEVVRTVVGLQSLQDDWIRLSSGNAEASIYSQPKLLALWWKYFGGDPQRPFVLKRGINLAGNICGTESLYVLVAYAGNEVVAVLPLMLLSVQPHGEKGFIRCLSFIGDPIFNPTPSMAYLKDKQESVFCSFAEFLKASKEWDVISLNSLRQDYKNLQIFLNVLETVVDGHVFRENLQEVRFAKCWEKTRVIKYLGSLCSSGAISEETKALMRFTEGIEKISDAEFAKECLPDITPRLKKILDVYERQAARDKKGILAQIEHEISQREPAVYQFVHLPGSVEEFESMLSSNKRYHFKKEKRLCEEAGIRVDFEKDISEKDFELFVKYHQQRHPHSVHLSEQTMDYYKDLLRQLSAEHALVWTIARNEKSEPVYFILCFHDRFANSLDDVVSGGEMSALNLGDYCRILAMEKGIAMNCACFSFRIGAEAYKARFHPTVVPFGGFILSRNADHDLMNMLPKHWSISGPMGNRNAFKRGHKP